MKATYPISTQRSHRRASILCALGLAVVVLVVYFPTLSSEFVDLDDHQYVIDNTLVNRPSIESLRRFFTEVTDPSTVAGYYQPLTMTSLMLDAAVTRWTTDGPFVFHLTNVLLHAVVAILIFVLLGDVCGNRSAAFLAALLYAVHPAQVESVAWISQRKTVLATALAVGSLICYLRHGRLQSTAARRAWFWASFGLYVVSGLAKPTVMLLPIALPLLDILPLRRRWAAALWEKWPFLLALLGMAWVTWLSQAATGIGRPKVSSLDELVRWCDLISYNLMLYWGNVFWPAWLSPYRAIPEDLSLGNPIVAVSLVLNAAIAVFWLMSWRWSRPFFVGIGAFLVLLSPALGAMRFYDSCVGDRFLYLPIVFLTIPAAALIGAIESRSSSRVRLTRLLVVLLAIPLALLTIDQQAVWANTRNLWTRAARTSPDLPHANSGLAWAYFDEAQYDLAEKHALRSLERLPDDPSALHVLGRIYLATHRPAEALTLIDRALAIGLGRVQAGGHASRAEALVALGRDEEARVECRESIESGARLGVKMSAAVYKRLGAFALGDAKRYDLAAEFLQHAVEDEPDDVVSRWNLGTALQYLGRTSDALGQYERVAEICRRKGLALPLKLNEAVEILRSQISGEPKSPPQSPHPGPTTSTAGD